MHALTKPQREWLKRASAVKPWTVVFLSTRLPAPIRRLLKRRMIERVCDEQGYQHLRITAGGRVAIEMYLAAPERQGDA